MSRHTAALVAIPVAIACLIASVALLVDARRGWIAEDRACTDAGGHVVATSQDGTDICVTPDGRVIQP